MSSGQSKDITNLINKFLGLKIAYILIGGCLEQQSWHPRLAIFICDCKELVFIMVIITSNLVGNVLSQKS
jgi:hypothetical protein